MRAHLLVLHRKESYSGEFGPEILSVCDEFTMDENPQWWADEVARNKAEIGSEASAWAEVVIDLPTDAVIAALYPSPTVPATIVATSPVQESA